MRAPRDGPDRKAMGDNGHNDPFEFDIDADDGGDPLVAGIRAAFGAGRRPERSASPTVLEVVGRKQKVPRVLLGETEPDDAPIVRTRRTGDGDYPAQIDRYHVIGEIARGGVGVILRARDLDLGREVALKVLIDRFRGDSEMTSRFLEEAQIGGQLQHPGIVPIHEIGLYDGDRPYLAMKLVRGQTLAELLESRMDRDQERPRFLAIFEQVCQTLAYAHSKGVIHRDLKPSNVMIGSFGEVQVMDWGLAKVLAKGGAADDKRTTKSTSDVARIATWRSEEDGSDSVAGSVMGTPAYMPPEQAAGDVDSLDERSDVFGLGAILCEILTGKPPYTGGTAREVVEKAKAADLSDALRRIDGCGADDDLIEIARSCLQADARERPRNAIVLAKRIRSHLESLEVRARQFEVRTAKTRFKLILAVIAIIGLLLGGSGYLVMERDRRERRFISIAAVDKAVLETERLRGQAMASNDLSTWEAALREADRAVDLSGRGLGPRATERVIQLRDKLRAEVEDQRILAQLERLKADRGTYSEERLLSFREVLSGLGIDLDTTGVEEAARILRASPIASSLVLAMDEWILLPQLGPLRKTLFDIAQAADSDPWRSRVRAAAMERDRAELSRLADEIDVREPDPSTFELLASALRPHRLGFPNASEEWAKAERVWRRAQQIHPGDFWINVHFGGFLKDRKDSDGALQFLRIAVSLRPRDGYARYELGSVLDQKGEAAAAVAEFRRSLILDPDPPFGYTYSRVSEILRRPGASVPEDEIAALVHGLRGIANSGDRYHYEGLVELLARSLWALGETRQAILTLEDSMRRRGAPLPFPGPFPGRRPGRPSRADLLREYRRRFLPDLASYASVDAILDRPLSDGGGEDPIAGFRKLHEATGGVEDPRLVYLDGRLLQREGRVSDAIPRFRQIVALDRSLPEPSIRLAECLRAAGESAEAESALRDVLENESKRCLAAWDLWVAVSWADPGRSARALLDAFPEAGGAKAVIEGDRGEDLRWALERIAGGEPILINCGGGDYAAPDGTRWGRDRFFGSSSGSFCGPVFFGEIAGTDADLLYRTERWFPPSPGGTGGYRIPLPRGTYDVTLHFAEIFPGLGPRKRGENRGDRVRSFDIRIEGKTVREGYEPIGKGFATADAFSVEASVEDGFLDIDLIHRQENPKISAIAVRARTRGR
ncbi:MAG: protein kinase [Planctomycetes bacterium]|nr:protein kinase [Planctomycetota bacterium]